MSKQELLSVVWKKIKYAVTSKFKKLIKKKDTNVVNNRGIISYYYNGQKYIIMPKIAYRIYCYNIYDEQNNDVTEELKPYMGPNLDFHNQMYTPEDLGYTSLRIIDEDFNEKIFYQNDKIVL